VEPFVTTEHAIEYATEHAMTRPSIAKYRSVLRILTGIFGLLVVNGCDKPRTPVPAATATRTAGGDVASTASWIDTLVPLPSDANSLVRRIAVRADSLPHSTPGEARSRIVFSDSSTLEVPLYHARLLDLLPAARGADWLIVSGVECSECDAPEAVWIFRGVPGALTRRGPVYVFPGTLTEAGLDDTPVFRSRLFLGACTADDVRSAVWFEQTLQPDSARRQIVRVVLGTPRLLETTYQWTARRESDVLSRVRTGRCREVEPKDQGIL
jgi:hypothetical protein